MLSGYNTIELAVISALLSLFLEFCFREGNIFAGWLDFIANKRLDKETLNKLSNKTNTDIQAETEGDYQTVREYKLSLVKWWWFKPLGYCVVCMNVWITLIINQIYFLPLMELGFAVLLSNFLVRYFYERIL